MSILLGSLAVFLIIGIPIGYSLGLSGFCYFAIVRPELLPILPQRFYAGMDSYAMIALPIFVLMGLLMNEGGITSRLIDFSLLFVGMALGMPAGLSSLVLQIQAVFTLLLSSLVLRDKPTLWQQTGIIIAFLGIGFLAIDKYETTSFIGLILVLASGFAWAISNIFMKLSGNIDMFRLIIWMSIIPPIPLFLISLLFEKGHIESILKISWTGAGSILYTAVISTVLGFALWGRLFREYSPNIVAPFALLVPIFGMVSSSIVLHENFTSIELLCSCLVFGGLFCIVFGPKLSVLRCLHKTGGKE